MLRESARELGIVNWRGDPSLTRRDATLAELGPLPALRAHAVEPTAIVFHRDDTGVCVGYMRWGSPLARDHGALYYHIHCADYQAMLHRLTHHTQRTYLPRSTRSGCSARSCRPGWPERHARVWRGALCGSRRRHGRRQEHVAEDRHGAPR